MRKKYLILSACLVTVLLQGGLAVNGGFESADGMGWTAWTSPWGGGFVFDLSNREEPYEGNGSLRMGTGSGSFGVYQEFCVEPGVEFALNWVWKGLAGGQNGWWEVLLIDGPYSYDAVDLAPDIHIVAKWDYGFGGTWPPPSPEWNEGDASLLPASEVVTVVLKCGANPGPVQAWFDGIEVFHDSPLLAINAVTPATGAPAGGGTVIVSGCNLPADAAITFGDRALVNAVRLDSCRIRGIVPPGEAGSVDVTLVSEKGTVMLVNGYTYEHEALETFIRGDTNSDVDVNLADAITLLGFLFADDFPPDCPDAADANDDGTLDLADAISILSYLFSDADDLPAPFPGCGPDGDPGDALEACVYPAGQCPSPL